MSGDKRWLDHAADPGRRAVRRALDEAAPAGPDELARQRVWAGVHAPWKRTSRGGSVRRWPMLAVIGAASVATALVGLRVVQHQAARGPVGAPPPASGSAPIESAHGSLHRLAGGVDAQLSPRATLIPGDTAQAPEVRQGRVRFSVPHQPPGQRWAVRAGAYRVVVLGTVFDVAVEHEGVEVSVASGVVQIEEAVSGRRLERVAAGEQWSSDSAPVPAVVAPPAERGTGSGTGTGTIGKTDAGGPQALAQAREARRLGEPRRALAIYGRLVAAGGALAESALYEMGTIEYEDLHDPAAALETWQRYRRRYPEGVLRAEADLSVLEVLPRLGQEGKALDEARAFLRRHPRSERRGEVARVAGDLARTRGDCRAAIELFEIAGQVRSTGHDADDAAFGRAACLHRLQDPRAAEAVAEYLRRFPAGRHAAEAGRLGGP